MRLRTRWLRHSENLLHVGRLILRKMVLEKWPEYEYDVINDWIWWWWRWRRQRWQQGYYPISRRCHGDGSVCLRECSIHKDLEEEWGVINGNINRTNATYICDMDTDGTHFGQHVWFLEVSSTPDADDDCAAIFVADVADYPPMTVSYLEVTIPTAMVIQWLRGCNLLNA